MRTSCLLLLITCGGGLAQVSPGSRAVSQAPWHAALQNLPAQPPRNTNVQNIEDFIGNVRMATPYFAGLRPGDYGANRELVRRMVTYLGGVDAMASDPRMRSALARAYMALAALNFGQYGGAPAGGPGEPPSSAPDRPHQPPFSMRAPEIAGVAPEDRKTADELTGRYESAAAEASAAWHSAEVLRGSLERQGMTLNASTAVSLSRMQLYFELAAEDLHARDWPNAKTNIERAEYETQKVFNTVGR